MENSQKRHIEVSFDGAAGSRAVVYKLAGCSHVAGTTQITGHGHFLGF